MLVLCVALLNPGCKKDEPTNNNNNNNNNQVQPLDMTLLCGTTSNPKKWYAKNEDGYKELSVQWNSNWYYTFAFEGIDSVRKTNIPGANPKTYWSYRFKGKDSWKLENGKTEGTGLAADHIMGWWYWENNVKNYNVYRYRILELTENRLVIQSFGSELIDDTRELFVTR